MFIFLGRGKISFSTQDCGETINLIYHKKGIAKINFHPIDKNKLLALVVKKRRCITPFCKPHRDLIYTKNFGKTWEKISKNVIDFSWAYIPETCKKGFPVNRIIILKQVEGGKVESSEWTDKYSVFFSDNFFTQKTLLKEHGNRFALSKHFLYIAQASDEGSQQVKLYVTRASDSEYKMERVQLPFPLFRSHSYTILDLSSKQVFIHVTHSIDGIQYGNVYKSDSTGSVFVLSAENNVKNQYGYCDFEKIKGMKGIYIINRYDEDDLERARMEIDLEEDLVKKSKKAEEILLRKSQISFDRGSTWSLISAPVSPLYRISNIHRNRNVSIVKGNSVLYI